MVQSETLHSVRNGRFSFAANHQTVFLGIFLCLKKAEILNEHPALPDWYQWVLVST